MFDFQMDLLVDESVGLYKQIKELEKKRQKISEKLKAYIKLTGVSVYYTNKNQSVWVRPSLYPSFADLPKEKKDEIVTWLYNNKPEYLTVSHSSLLANFRSLPADFPVTFTPDNFIVQVSNTKTSRLPQPLSEVMLGKIKKAPRDRSKKTQATLVYIPETKSPVKQLGRLEKIERKTNIIKDWMAGSKKTDIAKRYELSAPYIAEIISNYEKELVRTLIRR